MTVKIKINGPIISSDDKWFYDWFEIEATCPNDVLSKLPESGEDVEVTINSYGGLVDMGNEIYTGLRAYSGKVTANIVMAGSAASIIAMGANQVAISPVGQIMIHNVSMGAGGDYHEMEKASEILQKANHSLANAYVAKTGKSKEEVLALMENETWLTAEEAVENGFADSIMFENEERPQLVADGGSGLIPKKLINEVKKLKNQQSATVQMNLNDEQVQRIINDVTENLNKNIVIQTEIEKPSNESPFAKFLF
ncbi:head maturation protease, ClpP-related [Enterococcus casseliflavus]|uniref:head maturation protease, ClpP-related n=1 Tax=Enterococcus casseliflavus TaxID=37734 RepID=UPI003D0E165A